MRTPPSVALVTGASSGIGRATAKALAASGHVVIGTSRDSSRAAPLEDVTFLDLDVTSDESVERCVAAVVSRHGRIDVLVNNAGVGALGAAEESSTDQAKEVFDVNVFGVMRMTRAVLPHMREQGSGRIINVSSVLGVIPAPFMAVYAATKHALEGYSESVDHEVRAHGVRVLLVQPGYTRSQFEVSSMAPDAPLAAYAEQREVAAGVLSAGMRRADDPAVVADAIVEAATDAKARVRLAAGSLTPRVALLRRLAPAPLFDKQIRKLNRLPG